MDFSFPPQELLGRKQDRFGNDFYNAEPVTKTNTLYEFDIHNLGNIAFGPNTGFIINGSFECKPSEAADTEWTKIPLDEYKVVRILPNWFEHLVKDVEVYNGNVPLRPHDVPPHVNGFINTFIYSYMHKQTRNVMGHEPWNPVHNNFVNTVDWNHSENGLWHKYSNQIFNRAVQKFCYKPLHVFPFLQQPDRIALAICNSEKSMPPLQVINTSVVGKLTFRLLLKDDLTGIFRRNLGFGAEEKDTAGNLLKNSTNIYRYVVRSVQLRCQLIRNNPVLEKRLLASKTPVYFGGTTRFASQENVPQGVASHKVKLQDLRYPEGLFIFAIPKTVIQGTYQYQNAPSGEKVFLDHNITSLDVQWGGMPLCIKEPSLGQFEDDTIEQKIYFDRLFRPPFGIVQDSTLIRLPSVSDGAIRTPFPHVFINLEVGGPQTRVVPFGDDGHSVQQVKDMDIELRFGTAGQPSDATYIICAYYTDVNMVLKLKPQIEFQPRYKRMRNNN